MRISVITVCRNAEKEIVDTIESVLHQDYSDIEYIIADGKSTDHTNKVIDDVINSAPNNILVMHYSEKDSGIYNAMNKAISKVSGEWILFLNAGDTYVENDIVSILAENVAADIDFIYGDTRYLGDGVDYIMKGRDIVEIGTRMPFNHQSIMCRASATKTLMYDESFMICADYDMFQRAYMCGMKFKYINARIANYQVGGFSTKHKLRHMRELARIKKKNGFITNEYFYFLYIVSRMLVLSVAYFVLPISVVNKAKAKYFA